MSPFWVRVPPFPSGTGLYGAGVKETRSLARLLCRSVTHPTTEGYLPTNVNSAAVEKPCGRQKSPRIMAVKGLREGRELDSLIHLFIQYLLNANPLVGTVPGAGNIEVSQTYNNPCPHGVNIQCKEMAINKKMCNVMSGNDKAVGDYEARQGQSVPRLGPGLLWIVWSGKGSLREWHSTKDVSEVREQELPGRSIPGARKLSEAPRWGPVWVRRKRANVLPPSGSWTSLSLPGVEGVVRIMANTNIATKTQFLSTLQILTHLIHLMRREPYFSLVCRCGTWAQRLPSQEVAESGWETRWCLRGHFLRQCLLGHEISSLPHPSCAASHSWMVSSLCSYLTPWPLFGILRLWEITRMEALLSIWAFHCTSSLKPCPHLLSGEKVLERGSEILVSKLDDQSQLEI